MSEAKITVTAEDLASAILEKVRSEVKGVGESAQGAKEQGMDFGARFKEALEDPTAAAKSLGSELKDHLLGTLGESGVAIGVTVIAALALGGAMVELAAHSRETLAALHDAAEVTTLSVPGMSALKFAVESAGGSFDTANRALFMFEQRMENSGKKVDEGLRAIGLSLELIKETPADQRLFVISDALRNVSDDTNKAAVAMDIFGRQGRELLPQLLKPLGELADKGREVGAVFTDKDAKAADEFEVSLNTLKATTSATWTQVGLGVSLADEVSYAYQRMKLAMANVALTAIDVAGGFGYVKEAWLVFTDAIDQNESWRKYMPELKNLPKTLDEVAKAEKEAADKAKDLALSVENLFKKTWDYTANGGKPLVLSLVDQKAAERELTDEVEKSIKAHNAAKKAAEERATAEHKYMGEFLSDVHTSEKEGVSAAEAIGKSFKGMPLVLRNLGIDIGSIADTVGQRSMEMATHVSHIFGLMPDLSKSTAAIAHRTLTENFDELFRSDLPQTVLAAVEGGGNAWAAAGHLIGQEMGSNIDNMLVEHFSQAGGALGKLFSGKGLLSGIISGGLQTAIGVGVSFLEKGIGALFHMGGPSKEEKEGRSAEADFQKQFGSFDQMMKAVGGAYEATGRGAKQAEADVKALMEAEKRGGDAAKAAADKINQAFSDQKQDAADLKDALNEYHFSIEELGPALQKQQLGEQATKIMNQFRLLVGAGVDAAAVEDKMSGNINAYLQAAIKTGQEVPAAMKPMLEQMAKNGELLDENGNKITDLTGSGVTFAETMSDAADRIVKGFNDVLTKIGLLPKAIDDANKAAGKVPANPYKDWLPPTIDWNNYRPPDVGAPGASTGGYVTNSGIEHFDTGGANGRDTIHALVAPGEMIINPSQQRAISALMARGGGGYNPALESKIDRLHETMEGIRADFRTMPLQLRHAMRGSR